MIDRASFFNRGLIDCVPAIDLKLKKMSDHLYASPNVYICLLLDLNQ